MINPDPGVKKQMVEEKIKYFIGLFSWSLILIIMLILAALSGTPPPKPATVMFPVWLMIPNSIGK